MAEQFDFGRGDYRQIQSLDELVPGQKYIIRIRNPIRHEFISTYREMDQRHVRFDTALYMRSGCDHTPWAPPISPYDTNLYRNISRAQVSFDANQVEDNNYQIFSLGSDGNYITPDSPPRCLLKDYEKL